MGISRALQASARPARPARLARWRCPDVAHPVQHPCATTRTRGCRGQVHVLGRIRHGLPHLPPLRARFGPDSQPPRVPHDEPKVDPLLCDLGRRCDAARSCVWDCSSLRLPYTPLPSTMQVDRNTASTTAPCAHRHAWSPSRSGFSMRIRGPRCGHRCWRSAWHSTRREYPLACSSAACTHRPGCTWVVCAPASLVLCCASCG